MVKLGRYEKIVIISTFDKARTLGEISTLWYGNKGRLYQEQIQKEIDKSVKNGRLVKKEKQYQVNINFVKEIINSISGQDNKRLSKYKQLLRSFYINLGDYTNLVYLNVGIFRTLAQENEKKANELDLSYALQLPFLLSYIESENKRIYEIITNLLSLNKYVRLLQRLELQNYYIINESKRVYNFVETFEEIQKLFPKIENEEVPLFSKSIKAIKNLGR